MEHLCIDEFGHGYLDRPIFFVFNSLLWSLAKRHFGGTTSTRITYSDEADHGQVMSHLYHDEEPILEPNKVNSIQYTICVEGGKEYQSCYKHSVMIAESTQQTS